MTDRIKDGASYEDIVSSPDDKIAELVEGIYYLSPRPSARHTNAASTLGADIHDAFHRGRSGPGGWWILDEPELHLFGNVMVPDIAGWRRERMPELPQDNGFELAPDWLCEVVSPSTERFDRQQKLPRYAEAGVNHLWLADPSTRRLEVYGRVDADWVRLEEYSGDALVCAVPFEAVSIELSALWA